MDFTHGALSYVDFQRNPGRYLTYSGEAILKCRQIRDDEPDAVCFYLEPDPDGFPFEKHRVGLEGGDRFFLVAFEVDNDGQPINQELKLKLTRAMSSGIRQANRNKWVQSAGAMCREKVFQRFVRARIYRMEEGDRKAFMLELPGRLIQMGKDVWASPTSAEEVSVYYLRYYCRIKSRAELGFNSVGTERFAQLRGEYYVFLFDEE